MFRRGWTVVGCLGLWAFAAALAWGDEFERIEGEALAAVPRSKDATPREQLTIREMDALPSVLRESRSALLVATTGQGNFARLLVSLALRKAPGSDREPEPVLVLERFDTFEAGNLANRLARGKDLILFDGFRVDLDSGQVVPEDQGGDLQFQFPAGGEGGPRLLALGKAKLYTLAKAPILESAASARPSIGRAVLPGDFAGRYRLFANGQWSGVLDLKVDPSGAVSGRFRSDLNGAAYPVSGQVAADVPHKVAFTVKFPRTRQDYEGYLWTEGKGALAGTLTMLDRAFGFFALREGGRFAPEGEDVGPLTGHKEASTPGRRTVVVRKGQYTLDGQPRTDPELTEALKKAIAAEPATWVLLQVSDDEPFGAIQHAFEVIGAAGVGTIRLASADAAD
jgi:hypothetical protein